MSVCLSFSLSLTIFRLFPLFVSLCVYTPLSISMSLSLYIYIYMLIYMSPSALLLLFSFSPSPIPYTTPCVTFILHGFFLPLTHNRRFSLFSLLSASFFSFLSCLFLSLLLPLFLFLILFLPFSCYPSLSLSPQNEQVFQLLCREGQQGLTHHTSSKHTFN